MPGEGKVAQSIGGDGALQLRISRRNGRSLFRDRNGLRLRTGLEGYIDVNVRTDANLDPLPIECLEAHIRRANGISTGEEVRSDVRTGVICRYVSRNTTGHIRHGDCGACNRATT